MTIYKYSLESASIDCRSRPLWQSIDFQSQPIGLNRDCSWLIRLIHPWSMLSWLLTIQLLNPSNFKLYIIFLSYPRHIWRTSKAKGQITLYILIFHYSTRIMNVHHTNKFHHILELDHWRICYMPMNMMWCPKVVKSVLHI